MSEQREHVGRRGPRSKITQQIEAGARHGLSVGGGFTTATIAYFGAESLFKASGLISAAQESGIISESGALGVAEMMKGAALAFAAFKTGSWSVNQHQKARDAESGTVRLRGKK